MSSGISPCFTSISLVNIARLTSKMTMPRSYGAKSNFGVAPFKIFFAQCGEPDGQAANNGGVVCRVDELFAVCAWSTWGRHLSAYRRGQAVCLIRHPPRVRGLWQYLPPHPLAFGSTAALRQRPQRRLLRGLRTISPCSALGLWASGRRSFGWSGPGRWGWLDFIFGVSELSA